MDQESQNSGTICVKALLPKHILKPLRLLWRPPIGAFLLWEFLCFHASNVFAQCLDHDLSHVGVSLYKLGSERLKGAQHVGDSQNLSGAMPAFLHLDKILNAFFLATDFSFLCSSNRKNRKIIRKEKKPVNT